MAPVVIQIVMERAGLSPGCRPQCPNANLTAQFTLTTKGLHDSKNLSTHKLQESKRLPSKGRQESKRLPSKGRQESKSCPARAFKRAGAYRPRAFQRARAYSPRDFKRASAYYPRVFKRARAYQPRAFKRARSYHPKTFKRARAYRPRAFKRARAYHPSVFIRTRAYPIQGPSREQELTNPGPSREQEPTIPRPSREQEHTVPEPSGEQELTIPGSLIEQEPTIQGPSREQEHTVSEPSGEQEPTVQGPSREQMSDNPDLPDPVGVLFAVKMASHHFCRGHGFPFMRLRQALHLCVAHQRSYLPEKVGYIKPIKYCRAIWTRTKLKTSRPVFLFLKEVKPSEHFHSFQNRTRRIDVSLLELATSLRVHTTRVYPTEKSKARDELLRHRFLAALRSDIRLCAWQEWPKTLDSAVSLALALEAIG
uniref:Uncharacterized protein n=1 Tax=Timema monikensis TaxID=170555 RepID=A0A7R9E9V5_9NEOP|nr:unnamed protein product [Timema monikensis]